MRRVENCVGVRIRISMLAQRWVHADCVEALGECFVEEGLHRGPNLGLDHLPIVELLYRKDVCLS